MTTVRLELTYREIDFTLYDSIVVWKSTEGSSGPYIRATLPVARGARLPDVDDDAPSPAINGPYINAVGLEGTFTTQDGSFSVTITGSDPLFLSAVATQIQAGSAGRVVAFVVGTQLIVQTSMIGQQAFLEASGDLAAHLLLPIDTRTYGVDNNIPLIDPELRYSFLDYQGSSDYFYKTNFRSTSSLAESEKTGPFSPSDVADPTGTAVGYVRLRDGAGRPAQGEEIRIFSLASTQPNVTNIGTDAVALTDAEGYAAFTLLRGVTFQVVVMGTNLVRDVTVPTDEDIETFDLMDAAYGSDDAFTVQRPVIPAAPRRSI